jgi:hypothetical protein
LCVDCLVVLPLVFKIKGKVSYAAASGALCEVWKEAVSTGMSNSPPLWEYGRIQVLELDDWISYKVQIVVRSSLLGSNAVSIGN